MKKQRRGLNRFNVLRDSMQCNDNEATKVNSHELRIGLTYVFVLSIVWIFIIFYFWFSRQDFGSEFACNSVGSLLLLMFYKYLNR